MIPCVVLQYTLSKPNPHLEEFSAYSIASFFYKLVLLCYFFAFGMYFLTLGEQQNWEGLGGFCKDSD